MTPLDHAANERSFLPPDLGKGSQLQSVLWLGMSSLLWIPRVFFAQGSGFRSGDQKPTPPALDHPAGGTPGLGLTRGEPLRWYRPRPLRRPVEQDSRPVSSPATQHHPVPLSCLAIGSEAPPYLKPRGRHCSPGSNPEAWLCTPLPPRPRDPLSNPLPDGVLPTASHPVSPPRSTLSWS